MDRSALWNAAELAEKRKDACVAREYEVALPIELSSDERRQLVLGFAKDMANREGCAVDVAIHSPGKDGDHRNHHAHILRTTRKVEVAGLGAKLDTEKAGRKRVDDLESVRSRWAEMTNECLRQKGINARIDHRRLDEQGIDRAASKHLGPAATGYERRTGEKSNKRIWHERDIYERLSKAKEQGELDRQIQDVTQSIIDLSGDLHAAKMEQVRQVAAAGMAEFRTQFNQAKKTKENERNNQEKIEGLPAISVNSEIAKKASPQLRPIEELSIAQQVIVWDLSITKATEHRKKRVVQVMDKLQSRYERRYRAMNEVRKNIPEQPRGMLSVFKKGAYNEAIHAWKHSLEKAKKLEQEAAQLRSRVGELWHQASAWVYAKLRRADPEFEKRISDYRHAEKIKSFEKMQREREEKRERSRGQDRGMSR